MKKLNDRVTYKLATADDLRKYHGRLPDVSQKAWIFYLDGEMAGIAGYFIGKSYHIAFSEAKDGVYDKVSRLTIWRCAKMIMEELADIRPLVAVANKDLPTAPSFLRRLGFEFTGMSEDGGIYVINSSRDWSERSEDVHELQGSEGGGEAGTDPAGRDRGPEGTGRKGQQRRRTKTSSRKEAPV